MFLKTNYLKARNGKEMTFHNYAGKSRKNWLQKQLISMSFLRHLRHLYFQLEIFGIFKTNDQGYFNAFGSKYVIFKTLLDIKTGHGFSGLRGTIHPMNFAGYNPSYRAIQIQ